MVRLTGKAETGGAAGAFVQTIDPTSGSWRLDLATGPLREESGFDGRSWLRHDGITVVVDLPEAAADARTRLFLLRAGWRTLAGRRSMRAIGARRYIVELPGASPVELRFGAGSGDPDEAIISADGGPLTIRFADWRTIGGARIAFRREERDATGQVSRFIATGWTIVSAGGAALSPPADRSHAVLIGRAGPVPFEFDHIDHGHIVVPAEVDGEGGKLIFDTGAAHYLTPEAAKRFGLTVGGGVSIGGAGTGSIAGGYAAAKRIEIGPAALNNTVAMVAPLPAAATHPRPDLSIDGLTGFEFLSAYRTTIDYAARTIGFEPFNGALPSGVTVPFRTDGNGLFIQAAVEGHQGWFRLDTGDAGTITLFDAFARAAGLSTGEQRSVSGEVGGDLRYRVRTFASVAVGGTAIHAVRGEIAEQEAGSFGSRGLAGNIGAGLLSRFRLTIDFRARRIVFTPTQGRG